MTVNAATQWTNNGRMIEACVELRYLRPGDQVLDPTYGLGRWWTRWEPDPSQGGTLVKADLFTGDTDSTDGVGLGRGVLREDFRHMGWASGIFDVVAFDPPYVSPGGRETSTIPDFNARFGIGGSPPTPEALQNMIADGLEECVRAAKPRGILLVKAMTYVSSGKLWLGDYNVTFWAHELGCEVIDRLIMTRAHGGPQPARTRADGQPVRQHHARNNYSVLTVLRTPRA